MKLTSNPEVKEVFNKYPKFVQNQLLYLRELVLSAASEIEGLENCTKITDLTLFSNHITQLSGLETLKELNVLSVGSNKLKNLEDTIKYL